MNEKNEAPFLIVPRRPPFRGDDGDKDGPESSKLMSKTF